MGAPVDLIKRLIAAGVSDEDLQAINDAWQQPVPSVYTPSTETSTKASQRQARWRLQKRLQASTETSTVDGVVMLEKKDKKERSTAPRGTRLPDGWKFSDGTFEWALEHGVTREAVLNELDHFRDYWQSVPGGRGTKLDWDKTFKNRIRDIHARGKTNGHKSNLQLTDAERQERFREALRTGKAY